MDTSTCKGCWYILISLSGSDQTVFERCFSKYNAISFLYQNTMLKFVSLINLIKVDNIVTECSMHGDRYTRCVRKLCIWRRCIYFFPLRISRMSLQVLLPGDICLMSILISFGILITLQCSIGDPSIMRPMRMKYVVLLFIYMQYWRRQEFQCLNPQMQTLKQRYVNAISIFGKRLKSGRVKNAKQ